MRRMRELRNKKGLSGEKLGEIVGVQKSAISKYERGEIQPSNEVLVMIANALGTSTDYLLRNTDDPLPPEKEKAPINDRDLKIAFFGNPDEDDALLEDVRNYAQFVKERKQSQVKKDENAK